MLRLTCRKIHTALKITHNAANHRTAVNLFKKDEGVPKSVQISEAETSDVKLLKGLWTYPKEIYERLLLQEYDDKNVFKSANKVVAALKARNVDKADVVFPKESQQEHLELWTNTAILKNYKYSQKSKNETTKDDEDAEKKELNELNLVHDLALDEISFNRSIQSAYCTLYARDLINTRGSEATPDFIAQEAQKLYESNRDRVEMTVIRGDELQQKGLNLLYSVGKAASTPPHLIMLKYVGNPKVDKKLAIIGKGVTFDTGGLNLKPTNSIEEMYMDKSGACNSLAAFKWAVETSAPINLICTLALAENAISHASYKPLDIIKSLKGITVEIGNTDAEGRLCLADAFTYTQQMEKPDTIIDLATLTGACVVALGEQTAGVFGNDKALIKGIIDSGDYYQESYWQLPILKEHHKAIEGAAADINNSGKTRYGGASTAAAFLEKFIEKDVNWAHLDIAGPAMNKADREQFSKGGTAFGTQTLTKYMLNRIQAEAKINE